jgi:4-amino-4-deoxy-L-arabinose transferase-like glycosyltransferase
LLALGILCGLTALARQELVLLLPLLAIPVAWTRRDRGARAVAGALALIVTGGALVVGPWAVFNLTRFHDPVIISTNSGTTLAGANCDPGYYGPTIGLWTSAPCLDTQAAQAKLGDESEVEHAYRTRAFHYIEQHERRVPLVLAARIGRTWDLYRPADMVSYSEGENRERAVSWATLATFYPIALVALAGVVVLWRRRDRFTLWLLLVPCLLASATSVLASGSVRNRAIAEPALVLLAAVAVSALVDAARARRVPDIASG